MAQPLIRNFLIDLMGVIALPDPVYEFGSMQVEADQDGNLRALFPGRDFTGTDMREGIGVDRVEDLRQLSIRDGEVGTALCLDTLEHCEDPPQACRELHRVTAPGGVCVISSVMLFGIHAYPSDYFRFTPEGFRAMLSGFDDVWVAGIGPRDSPMQVIGVGTKDRRLDLSIEKLPSLAAAQHWWDAAPSRMRIGPLLVSPREVLQAIANDGPRLFRESLARRLARRS